MERLVLILLLMISGSVIGRNPFSFAGSVQKEIVQQQFEENDLHPECDIARTGTQWNIAQEQVDAVVLKHKDDGHVCQIQLTTT